MKILITGANGFIGKNLVTTFRNLGMNDLYLCDIDTTEEQLDAYTSDCDVVYHLAGINRPENIEEFMTGNAGFTDTVLEKLVKHQNRAPVILTSSIQAALDNPYGKSKLAAEKLLEGYARHENAPVHIFRLPNVFGKWCRPNYNSVVATFCNNIAAGIDITINNTETELTLVYIDDVVKGLMEYKENIYKEHTDAQNDLNNTGLVHYHSIPTSYKIRLGELAKLITSFHDSRTDLSVPDMGDELTKKLYSTYLSYLPKDSFSYPLQMKTDERGSFTEFIRTPERGQVSVNISKPGITKGNHWHHSKNEKFLVVKGEGVIQFRKIESNEIIEYHVSGAKLEVVDIPTGYTHNIINIGTEDMVTVMWANEAFDPEHPDTWFMKV